jgi:hypothetical protein
MGGTLHRDRSNFQEEPIDYKTRRQEKMRATHGMQNNFNDFMGRRTMAIENFELLPSEPRT